MKSADGLYPIIRRIRRPLLPVDPPTETKAVTVDAAKESKPTATAESAEIAEERKVNAADSNK